MGIRAVLIRPSNKTGSAYMTKWGFLPAPLGLLTLAGEILRVPGSTVEIIDMEGDSLELDDTIAKTLSAEPDLVGITLHATAAHNNAGYIARKIKEKRPKTVLVAGGHHATFLPNEILRGGFDIVVLGEGDETMYDIAMSIEKGANFSGVGGIVYRDENRFVRTKPRKLISDLDSLPLPPLHLLDSSKYTFQVFGRNEKVMCLETSRGCPYACDFCSVTPTWGNKWRNKSNRRIIEEIKSARNAGYNWIFFTDDIFLVYPNVKSRIELFNELIEADLDMKWIVQMRADVTARNPEVIKLAARAGMSIAFLGVESGSEEILKKMHKGEFTPQSVDAVKILSDNGIVVLVGMMIGAPYERIRDIVSTIRFSRALARAGADAVQFSIYTPLPGTRVFNEAMSEKSLFTMDWDRYDVLTPVMKTKTGPVLDHIAQFYASYSFYIYKFLRGKLKGIRNMGRKKNLVDNAMHFILKMMPVYIRDFLHFPRFLMRTYDLYWNGKKANPLDGNKAEEVMNSANKIIYDISDGNKNPYYMIK